MSQPADRLDGQVALVTGGGRGIGAGIARELASAGAHVAVAARTRAQVEHVAREIHGVPIEVDVTDRASVEHMVIQAESELGPIDLLAANAGIGSGDDKLADSEPERWWRTHEVNVLGVYLSARAVIPGMLERGGGRIVITGSGAAYLPGGQSTAYAPSKAAVCRYGEMLANELAGRIPVFFFSPGLVRTELNAGALPEDAPWTPPELAPELVRKLSTGGYDALAGRYLHAEHDDVDELLGRIDEIRERDLNEIRLRR